jgi:hypothetical protein
VNTQIPTQYSTTVELSDSPFRDVMVCFTPMLRAGCEPDWRWSYVKFIFRQFGMKDVEHSFMPVERWNEHHFIEWHKVMAELPKSFDIDRVFEQAALDLVL